MKKLLFLLSLVSLGSFAQTKAELDPVIISSKQNQKISELTSSTLVITNDQIEQRSSARAVEVLNQAAGVDVVQTGLLGGQSSIFLRGMESRHTLILIDGTRVYDPSNASRSFNLAILNALDIEKIEVIKGSQSVLYGTDAIAGVINIVTKKGSEKNSFRYGTGYYDEIGVNHTLDTTAGLFNFVGYFQESQVDSVVKDKAEKDLVNSRGITVNHFYEMDRLEFNTVLKMTNNFTYDDADLTATGPTDDANAYTRNTHTFLKEGLVYHHNDLVDVNVDVSYAMYDRYNKYLSSLPSNYQVADASGSILTSEIRVRERLSDGELMYGINNIQEEYELNNNSQSMALFDVFAIRSHKMKLHVFDYGARFTTNASYGSHFVYSLGYNYLIDEAQVLKVNQKTGFKAPSTYQLNDPSFGNSSLAPEKSVGFDVEYLYRIQNLRMNASMFFNEVSDFIEFSNSTYANVNSAKYSGIEGGFELVESIGVVGANIVLTTYDLTSGREAARRPKAIAKLNYLFNFTDEHSLNIDFQYRGESYDYSNNVKKTLDPFDVWNVDYTYDAESFKVVGSVKNLFDREYETIFGYSTLGTAFQINVTARY